ncbi:MAG: alpha/beta fold hydrolase, partial [Solirubrobacteraceae bacterium]
VLGSGPRALHSWRLLAAALARCTTTTIPIGGHQVAATLHPMPFERIGDGSSAYAWSLTDKGVRVGFDLVLFRTERYTGELIYSSLGPPPLTAVRTFAQAAVAKAGTGSTARIPSSVSIATAPARTARTALGPVAYREIGAGPPLLLITGYLASLEGWDPRFVDALAQRHRVVVFDNAGIGPTRALSPLTIDAMANQSSALISALGLGRTDVLGWSMGSMIAQALAVLHPSQVGRLVLCAAYPGNGTTVRPPQAAIDALNSGSEQRALAVMFPADQIGARDGYLAALTAQPAAPALSAATEAAQAAAIKRWWSGQDPAGRRPQAISAPTLIADGAQDQLDPISNSRLLARLIPRARLLLYPDAGHAFLFQDHAQVAAAIEAFLGAAG